MQIMLKKIHQPYPKSQLNLHFSRPVQAFSFDWLPATGNTHLQPVNRLKYVNNIYIIYSMTDLMDHEVIKAYKPSIERKEQPICLLGLVTQSQPESRVQPLQRQKKRCVSQSVSQSVGSSLYSIIQKQSTRINSV